jgi:hypothetical protein
MPKGRGHQFQGQFGDERLERWNWGGVNIQNFLLDWREQDGKLIGRVRAFHRAHALYLEGELDVDAAAESHKDKAVEEKPQLNVSANIRWIVGAEAGPEVFDKRRREAIDRMGEIRAALASAVEKHAVSELCGRLDDTALRERLGLEWKAGGDLGPEQYHIRAQLFGDVEILAGEPMNGGTRWVLFNLKSGETVRSYQ